MLKIEKVQYVSGYKLRILFSNGKTKIVDFEDWILEDGAYVKPLRDIEYFKKVSLDDFKYSICWPNGADFSPDVLFEVGQEVRKTRKTTKSRSRKVPKRIKK